MKKKFKIIGEAFKHCNYSNNPLPPTSFSPNIEWDWNVFKNEDLVFYVDDAILNPLPGHKRKIAYMIEPYIKKPNLYKWLTTNHKLFDIVLMNDKESMKDIPNSIFYPFGGCWIEPKNRKFHNKTKLVSIICSNKKQVPDHFKRHELIQQYKDVIDVMGRGYNPISSITQGLKDYRFHIAMENQKRDFHFSEKLINPIMTGTIPIYWGMPSIGDYFDTRGMILMDDINQFKEIYKSLGENLYQEMLPYAKQNFELAQNYILSEDWIFNNLKIFT